jgi:hypothetical protein
MLVLTVCFHLGLKLHILKQEKLITLLMDYGNFFREKENTALRDYYSSFYFSTILATAIDEHF